jgi:N-acetylglucosaminyl-diphospho-decaprenol L-rhamnosyltransferase
MFDTPTITVSVVSHGQGTLIANLLEDLAQPGWNEGQGFEVVVTLNIPEDEAWLASERPYPIRVLRNEVAKGFGANHNAAFEVARGRFFAVVNPDIRLADFQIGDLLDALARPDAGVCGPLVLSPHGGVEDSARRFPTFIRLFRRKLLRERDPDYRPEQATISVDWLAGMFLLFPSAAYKAIGGFDERYFMYLEDVEISRILRRRGLQILWVGTTAVIHDASRASRRSFQHLKWHLASLFRYFFARSRT